jgi:hypothetical protein
MSGGAYKAVDAERRRLAALPEGPIFYGIADAPDPRRARILGIEAVGQGTSPVTGLPIIAYIRTEQGNARD